MDALLTIDGTHGDGGGQILRTALSLSLITGRPFRMVNIRAGRPKAGLRPQHLSALRAAADVGDAVIAGDHLGSSEITFSPAHRTRAASYTFDVAAVVGTGSAGSATLILQTLLLPLALADGSSRLSVAGGTHVPWSPPFDDICNAYLPALRKMGLRADIRLLRWGWYPVGQGQIACDIAGRPPPQALSTQWLAPLSLMKRGVLKGIDGRAAVTGLPDHIPQRIIDAASQALQELNVPVDLALERVDAACVGTGLFLTARYEHVAASFSALGMRGKPAEAVAMEAVRALKAHHRSEAVVELHLADQLLLPLATSCGVSDFTVEWATQHLVANAWTIEQFGTAKISIQGNGPARVSVHPQNARDRLFLSQDRPP